MASLSYKSFDQPKSSSVHCTSLWKTMWQSPNIPKVNFFIWTLKHQKVLTSENLIKRRFYGPFGCCFCKQAKESSDYIFLGCEFAQKAWSHLLSGLSSSVPSNFEPDNLFAN